MLARPSHEPSLAWPFFAVGLASSAMLAGFLDGVAVTRWTSICFVAISSVACAFVGRELSLRGARRPLVGAARAAVHTLVVVGMAGFGVAVFEAVDPAHALGLSLRFVPALVILVILGGRVGRARQGSLVDRLDRQALLSVVLAAVTIVSVWKRLGTPLWIPLVFVVALVGHGMTALEAARRAIGAAALAGGMLAGRSLSSPDAEVESAEMDLDLGLGSEEWVAFAPAADAYRDTERLVARVVGDPGLARLAVISTLRLASAAIACVVAATASLPW